MLTKFRAKLSRSKLKDADTVVQRPHHVSRADGSDKTHNSEVNTAHDVLTVSNNETPVAIPDNYDPSVSPEAKRDSEQDRLWDMAFSSLDDDTKALLDPGDTINPEDAIERVKKDIEEKYEEYKKGGLQIRKRNGSSFNFRDATSRILSAVLKAKPIFSSVASLDPTGHASSAWTIISLGLTMVENDIDRRDAIFEACEFLADKLAYYSIIDDYCWRHRGQTHERIRQSLIGIYTAIFCYTAEVKKRSNENYGDQMEAGEAILQRIDETVSRLKAIQDKTLSAEEERILDWLSRASFSDIQNGHQERRAANTGDWFLDTAPYQDWIENPGILYWLHGVAGCGKSIICSTIIKDIKKHCQKPSSTPRHLAYCPCFASSAQHPSPPSITKLWESHSRPGTKPDQQTLCEALDEALRDLEGQVFLVLDALDECPNAPGRYQRNFALDFLLKLQASHPTKLHILATSRPEPDIRSRFEGCRTLDLEMKLGGDVETFVRAQVAGGPIKEFDSSIQNKVIEKLLDTPERRFRWADLQIKRLEECFDEDEINHALETIPDSLEATYRDILNRMAEKNRVRACKILMWISMSIVPVTLDTVAAAVHLPSPNHIINICTTSLVTVNTADDTVKLAHFSVQEFLVLEDAQQPGSHEWYQFSIPAAHYNLAVTALQCLLDRNEPIPMKHALKESFLVYAARYWDEHVAKVGDLSNHPVLLRQIEGLLSEEFSQSYLNWLNVLAPKYDNDILKLRLDEGQMTLEECHPPIYHAAGLGLEDVVVKLLGQGVDPLVSSSAWNFKPGRSLIVAARNGHLNILEKMLERCGHVPQEVAEEIIQNVDHREAGSEWLERIMQALWICGAFFEQSQDRTKVISHRLVLAAIMNEHAGLESMRFFLDRQQESLVTIATDTKIFWETVRIHTANAARILELLFERQLTDIWFNSLDFLGYLAGNPHTYALFKQIIQHEKMRLKLGDAIAHAVARYGTSQAMGTVIQILEPNFEVTEKILLLAVENRGSGPEVLRQLLGIGGSRQFSHKLLFTAANNYHNCLELLNILLDEVGPHFPIGEEVMIAIVPNQDAVEIITNFLTRQQAGFVVSERVITSAISNWNFAVDILQLLMKNGGSDIQVTDEMICAAAAKKFQGDSVLKYLSDVNGPYSHIPNEAFLKAVESPRSLEILFALQPGTRVSDEMFIAACQDREAMSLLLGQQYESLPIEKMLEEIGRYGYLTAGAFDVLLSRQVIEMNEWVLERVACNRVVMGDVLAKHPNVAITQKAFENAAKSGSPELVRAILETRFDGLTVTEQVMEAPFDTSAVAGLNEFTTSMLKVFIVRLGSEVPITKNLLQIACEYEDMRPLKLLLDQRRKIDLQSVWERIWQAEKSKRWKLRVTDILLQYETLVVSEAMLEAIPFDWKETDKDRSEPSDTDGDDSDFETLIQFSLKKSIAIVETERVVELVVQRCSEETVKEFLDSKPNLKITEKTLRAAEKNSVAMKERLAALSVVEKIK
ncbi:hypothetical protein N7481_002801 [Penicillium waksmanii]|uniref:uncharacterized protein n=1 Tax=Penicillium waksmanii TaxID=69791 RepID=UPI002547F796|nr:uncharacterized protein N7481_002801 [Penicillium waksmanii]KAJ5995824.1 hypothetical protein N7481_002801 [Penicillium waksmanii]